MSHALRLALTRLLEAEDGRLPASQFTHAQRLALDNCRSRTGALCLQRSGRGSVYCLTDRVVIEQHLRRLAPLNDKQATTSLPRRAAHIGHTRSSKGGRHNHEWDYLLLRSNNPVSWHNDDGDALDLQAATRQQGAAALRIGSGEDTGWHTTGTLWLLENQALFDRLDWLPAGQAASVLWYSGQLRHSLVHWLAQRPRAGSVILFPDYDGVGLHNYTQLKKQLGDECHFWLMPGWQQKLTRYGNNELWQKTAREFNAALPALAPLFAAEPVLKQLVTAMQTQGLALEQEAVWLPVEE
ncbi:MAG: hypothetical protein GYB41_17395 [Oceanospirillales bacterium]|nr:hypothetical protein [Oceanospirillales bacterium]